MENVIKEFRYQYNFLSNFSRYPLIYQGILFKWAKCETDIDRNNILNCETPTQVKKYGHIIKCDIKKWDLYKIVVMEEILKCKFSQEKLKKKLIDTKDAELIEGNYWHDQYWGKCFCPKCKNKQGQNHLGKLLMKIRDDFKK